MGGYSSTNSASGGGGIGYSSTNSVSGGRGIAVQTLLVGVGV